MIHDVRILEQQDAPSGDKTPGLEIESWKRSLDGYLERRSNLLSDDAMIWDGHQHHILRSHRMPHL